MNELRKTFSLWHEPKALSCQVACWSLPYSLSRQRTYLEVHGVDLVSLGVTLAQHPQHRGHFVRVVQTLNQRVDGRHDPASVPPQLRASLQLLSLLNVPEVFEVLPGRGEVHEKPAGRGGGRGGQPDFVSDESKDFFLVCFCA